MVVNMNTSGKGGTLVVTVTPTSISFKLCMEVNTKLNYYSTVCVSTIESYSW